MSVVVRMEMPENCCECQLRQEDFDTGEEFCPFTGVECLSIGRQNNCPILCQLPEGHGRLIDEEELFYNLFVVEDGRVVPNYDCNNFPINMPVKHIKRYILEAPTIVPAERSEK